MEAPSVTMRRHSDKEPIAQVEFRTSQGLILEGQLVRLTPYSASFRLCGSAQANKVSRVVEDVDVHKDTRSIYKGRATVRSVTNLGTVTACEAVLAGNYNPLDLKALEETGR